jgi:site-specific DNA-methyltransferase (adenine-specific)
VKNIVHLCDCMDFLRNLPDKAYDLAIVDPPYGHKRFDRPDCIKNNIGSSRLRKYGHTDYNLNPPGQEYFNELFRVSKHQIIWGANYYNQFLPNSQGWIFWYKHQPVHNFADGEFAFCSIDLPAKCFDFKFFGSHGADQTRIHPNQKPIALYKWLLKNYAKPGQTIFDSHVGSGSIRIACHDMGFDFEGCELDPDYWQAQEQRYKIHVSQPEIFEKKEMFEQANLM